MNKLIIIGAGGHGKVIADIAHCLGYKDISFIDDRLSGACMGFPIIGTTGEIGKQYDSETDYIIGIGDNAVRRSVFEKYAVNWVTLIHPSAQIGMDVSIEKGTVVMANAVINPGARVGKGVIINTASSVDHDCMVSDFSHIAVGAHLAGTVSIGESVTIGAGAVVINNCSVCCGTVVGAGAVVVRDIDRPGIYVGVPAKRTSKI